RVARARDSFRRHSCAPRDARVRRGSAVQITAHQSEQPFHAGQWALNVERGPWECRLDRGRHRVGKPNDLDGFEDPSSVSASPASEPLKQRGGGWTFESVKAGGFRRDHGSVAWIEEDIGLENPMTLT